MEGNFLPAKREWRGGCLGKVQDELSKERSPSKGASKGLSKEPNLYKREFQNNKKHTHSSWLSSPQDLILLFSFLHLL